MGILVNKVGRADPRVQEALSRCLLRLRNKRFPRWEAYIKAAYKGEVKAKGADLIRIRNAALRNLSQIRDLQRAGAMIKLEDPRRFAVDLLYVILNATVLMERVGKKTEPTEKRSSSDRATTSTIEPDGNVIDLGDRMVRRGLGIEIDPKRDF